MAPGKSNIVLWAGMYRQHSATILQHGKNSVFSETAHNNTEKKHTHTYVYLHKFKYFVQP